MKQYSLYLIGFLCLFACSASIGQTSVKGLKKQGEKAFEEGRYIDAAESYRQYIEFRPNEYDALADYGIVLYEINQLDKSLEMMLSVVKNKRKYPDILNYYIARAYHHKEQFDRAAKYYKSYISKGSDKNLVDASVAQLLRCESGKLISRQDKYVFVDNMGPGINTIYNEFNPIMSPRSSDRLYFTAELNDESFRAGQQFPTYIFGTEQRQGRWSERGFMNEELNTDKSEILYGFSSNGMEAYYSRGENRPYGILYVDKISSDEESVPAYTLNFPANPAYGDKDIFFINDNTVIFSAIREEGYGGYDLYISRKHNDTWSQPRNLGPTINSAYNESAPFLTKDFSKLIFSSDRPESIGGYDFFIADWNVELSRYTNVSNMGVPLNSAGDDMYFALSDDGITCYFSSSRKTGYGGLDIYVGYFKKPFESSDYAFNAIDKIMSNQEYDMDSGDTPVMDFTVKEDITFESALYPDGGILSQYNKRIYDIIAETMSKYPGTVLRIQVFSDEDIDKSLGLYFSIKTGEQVADYLKSKGVKADRVHLTGCGSSFPLAQNIPGNELRNLERINTRIDFKLLNTENYPITMDYKFPYIPPAADRTAYDILDTYNEGISYRVQIAAYGQRYNSPLLDEERNALIYTTADSDVYKYTLGLFKNLRDAEVYSNKLKTKGATDAFVVVFIDGVKKNREELMDLLDIYPDIEKYLESSSQK